MKALAGLVIVAALLGPAVDTASACGYCDGDRIAAVYDAAVIADAKSKGLGVVAVGIEGPFGGSAQERTAIAKAVEGVPGVVKGSVFISYSPSAVRFVFRPSKGGAKTVVGKASAALKQRTGCTLVVLRVECDTAKH